MRLAARHRDVAALALGFALDRALGDPARGHPVAGFGHAAAMLERRTWRARRAAGILHVALVLSAVGAFARRGARNPICAALVVWATLGGRSLEWAALTMVELLEQGSIDAARPCDSFPGLGDEHIRLAVRTPGEHALLAGAITRALEH